MQCGCLPHLPDSSSAGRCPLPLPLPAVDVQGEAKTFSPEEISAMILTKMKDTAEVGHYLLC